MHIVVVVGVRVVMVGERVVMVVMVVIVVMEVMEAKKADDCFQLPCRLTKRVLMGFDVI